MIIINKTRHVSNRIFKTLTGFFLLAMLLLPMTSRGQELKVTGFWIDQGNTDAIKYAEKDHNGQLCALIKVRLANYALRFRGDIIKSLNPEESEFWVYMTAGSTWMEISCPGTSKLTYDFPANMRLEGGMTYIMQLERVEHYVQKKTDAEERAPTDNKSSSHNYDDNGFALLHLSFPIKNNSLAEQLGEQPVLFGASIGLSDRRGGWYGNIALGGSSQNGGNFQFLGGYYYHLSEEIIPMVAIGYTAKSGTINLPKGFTFELGGIVKVVGWFHFSLGYVGIATSDYGLVSAFRFGLGFVK